MSGCPASFDFALSEAPRFTGALCPFGCCSHTLHIPDTINRLRTTLDMLAIVPVPSKVLRQARCWPRQMTPSKDLLALLARLGTRRRPADLEPQELALTKPKPTLSSDANIFATKLWTYWTPPKSVLPPCDTCVAMLSQPFEVIGSAFGHSRREL